MDSSNLLDHAILVVGRDSNFSIIEQETILIVSESV